MLFYGKKNDILARLNEIRNSTGQVYFDEYTQAFILLDLPERILLMTEMIEAMDSRPKEDKAFAHTMVEPDMEAEKQTEPEVPVIQETKNIDNKVSEETQKYFEKTNGVTFDVKEMAEDKTDQKKVFDRFKFFKLTGRESEDKFQAKVTILAITLNDEHQQGVDWEAILTNYQSLPFLGFRSTAKHNPAGVLKTGTISNEDYAVLLEALDTVGVLEILEDDKFKGHLKKTYDVDIKPDDKLNVTDIREYTEMFRRNEFVRLSFLSIKDAEGLFEVSIAPEIRPNYYADDVGELVVELENKHVIVIGSLFKDIQIQGTKKIPVLGDLPLLGFAFRNQQESIRKVEYVVFLTFENIK